MTAATKETSASNVLTNEGMIPDFGNGRYSNIARELFRDSQILLGITPKQAERLARCYTADLGRHLANQPVKVELGRITKDARITLKESATMKGVTCTYPITLAKLVVSLQDAKKLGVAKYDKITLTENAVKFLDDRLNEPDAEKVK